MHGRLRRVGIAIPIRRIPRGRSFARRVQRVRVPHWRVEAMRVERVGNVPAGSLFRSLLARDDGMSESKLLASLVAAIVLSPTVSSASARGMAKMPPSPLVAVGVATAAAAASGQSLRPCPASRGFPFRGATFSPIAPAQCAATCNPERRVKSQRVCAR
jgi:hypothetical protein